MASRPAVWLVFCGLVLGSDGAVFACTSAADCDDGDRCTLDACAAGECVCEVDPACAAQGCTPGYWKTNAQKRGASAWPVGYMPSTKIRDLFAIPACIGTATGNATLLQGLGFAGGSSLKVLEAQNALGCPLTQQGACTNP